MPSFRRSKRRAGVRSRCSWLIRIAAALALAPCLALAPPVTPPATPPVELPPEVRPAETVTAEMIQPRLAALEAIAQPSEAQAQAIAELRQALAFLQEAADEAARAAEFDALGDPKNVADRLAKLPEELGALAVAAPGEDVAPDAKASDLTPQLEAARAQLEAEKKLRNDVIAEADRRKDRRARVPEEIAANTTRRGELQDRLRTPPDPQVAPEVAEARRLRRMAEMQAVEARLARLPKEIRSYDARRELLEARRQLHEKRVADAQRVFDAWDKLISERRVDAAEQARREAAAASKAAANAHSVVSDILEENEALAKELATKSTRNQNAIERRKLVDAAQTRWSNRFEDMKKRVEQIGLNDFLGIMLREDRSELPTVRQQKQRLDDYEERMVDVQLLELRLAGVRDRIDDVDAEAIRLVEAYEAANGAIPEAERPEVLAAAREALVAQKRYVSDLLTLLDAYFNDGLNELYPREREFTNTVIDYRRFIEERILWIQSTEPIGENDLADSWRGGQWLISPTGWTEVGTTLWNDLKDEPIPLALGTLFIIALLVLQRRFRRQLRTIAQRTGRITTDSFGLTMAAAGLTVAIAGVWPLALWILAWRLNESPTSTPFSLDVAEGLRRVAFLWLVGELLRQMCRTGGLAATHLRWSPRTLATLRRHLTWVIPVVLPLAFIIATTRHASEATTSHAPEGVEAIGRFAFLAGMLAGAVFIHRVLHPRTGIMQALITRYRGGWLDRLKFFWFNGLVLAPIGLAVAASMGFFYTALQLHFRFMESLVIVAVVTIAHGLCLRWLLLAQRRLALEQARERAAKARADSEAAARGGEGAAARPKGTGSAEAPVRPEEVQVDVEAIGAQTRSLVRSLVGFAVVIGLFMVWVDVLPALGILRQIELWSQLEAITRTVSGDLGPDLIETVQEKVPITLADLLLGIVIFAVAMVVSKNIPGLLEIVILRRLPFSPSGRYAITTIVRYALFIIGVVLAFGAVGIGWSKVQWLAAAVVFGLGFGLQEIFANFVSGLIILFERPVRVGDTVTVGDISGTVSRIRIRATTITDWDRKELIIPNKNFVTGQIVNWSLSDSIIRVKIPVGIAYGSDTQLAKKLMLDVARQTPHVLTEPAPNAVFLGFGDSSLNFELRVFIPHIDHFVPTRDALHMAVDRAFREAKIEIAFPQRDLHIRSIDSALPTVPAPERVESPEPGAPTLAS